MNIVTNSYLAQMMPECKFWFEPIADDTGNSIGACIYSYKNETGDTNKYPLKDTFFHGYDYDLGDVYLSINEGSDVGIMIPLVLLISWIMINQLQYIMVKQKQDNVH